MSLIRSSLAAAFVASIANAALLFLGKPYAPAPETFGPFHIMPVVMWTVLGTVGAALVYYGMRRFAANADRLFLYVAGAVLLLSFIPDYLLKDVPAGSLFGGASMQAIYLLMLMHVVSAVIIVWFLLKSSKPTTV